MPRIPISFRNKSKVLMFEEEAYSMNHSFDTQKSIRDRTMTRESYYKLTSWMRGFTRNIRKIAIGV